VSVKKGDSLSVSVQDGRWGLSRNKKESPGRGRRRAAAREEEEESVDVLIPRKLIAIDETIDICVYRKVVFSARTACF